MTDEPYSSQVTPAAPQVNVVLLAPPLLASLVALVLRHLAADCRMVASTGDLADAVHRPTDLVIADVDQYPDAPRASREDGHAIPCIGLLRRRDAQAKLEAFERGAHDLIEVPFTPDEIVVRSLAAVTRTTGRKIEMTLRVTVGRFGLDLLRPGVSYGGKALPLTLLERTLLYLFLAQPQAVLTRDEILRNIWGGETAVTSNVIDRHIRDLRVKLGESWRQPSLIETVPGQGYRFIAADAGGVPIA